MGALLLADFVDTVANSVGVPAHVCRFVHQRLVDILMVDAENAAVARVRVQFAGIVQSEKMHPVVVVAGAMVPFQSRFRAQVGVFAQIRADRVAVGVQDMGTVTLRYGNLVKLIQ